MKLAVQNRIRGQILYGSLHRSKNGVQALYPIGENQEFPLDSNLIGRVSRTSRKTLLSSGPSGARMDHVVR